jgi:high-affinity Fe2+/Pb2+ permease
MTAMTVAASTAGHYLHWGVISVSLTNALIILAMVVVFVVAILLPLGRDEDSSDPGSRR